MPSADTGHASGSKESWNIACVCQSCVQLRNLQSLYSSSAYSVNPLLPASSPPSSFCSRLSMFLGSLYVRTHCTLKYDMSLSVGGRVELNLPYFLQRWCVSIYQGHGHHHSHHRHSQPHSVSHAYDDGSSNDRDCAEDADHSNYEEQGGSVNGNIHHLFHFVNPALRSLSLGLRLLQRSAERLGRILLEHSFLSFSFLVSLFSVQKVYLEAAVSPFAILESLPFSSPSSSINNAENNTEYKSPSSPSSNVADGNVVEVDSVYHARGAVLQPCEGSSAPRYAPGSSRIPSYIEKMYSTFAPTVPSFSSSDISKPSPPPPPPLPTNLLGPDLQSLSPRAPPSHPRTHSVLEALSSYLLQQDEHGGFAYSEVSMNLMSISCMSSWRALSNVDVVREAYIHRFMHPAFAHLYRVLVTD